MVEAAEASGLKLMVDFHARWHPLFMGAKGYVERGELGAPVMAYARLSDTIHVPTEMLNWSGHSGPEWFLFPHTMDVVRWLFGRRPGRGLRQRLSRRARGQGHRVLGRDPGDDRVRRPRLLHVRNLVDRSEQLHERRRQPAVAVRRNRAASSSRTSRRSGRSPTASTRRSRRRPSHATARCGATSTSRSATSSTAWRTM